MLPPVYTPFSLVEYARAKSGVNLYVRWRDTDSYISCLRLHELLLGLAMRAESEEKHPEMIFDLLSAAHVMLGRASLYLPPRADDNEAVDSGELKCASCAT